MDLFWLRAIVLSGGLLRREMAAMAAGCRTEPAKWRGPRGEEASRLA